VIHSCLACTVRGCGRPLERHGNAFVCPAGHSFDVARSGYVNLLQPQDRRSRAAGDSTAALAARAGLFADGISTTIVHGVAARAAALDLDDTPLVTDLGCGTGELLAAVARFRPIAGVGNDISPAAVERAARAHPAMTWVVANADRRLPFLDTCVQLVLSLHGRRNPSECARVLGPRGFLLVAVPAPDDLIELRALVDGERVARDRGIPLISEHEPAFRLLERTTIRERHRLERADLVRLLRGTYRGERRSAAARIGALERVDVTLASELFVFAPRSTAPARSPKRTAGSE
jgi:23S rRNA (guanine745-N1)-methyltransferase